MKWKHLQLIPSSLDTTQLRRVYQLVSSNHTPSVELQYVFRVNFQQACPCLITDILYYLWEPWVIFHLIINLSRTPESLQFLKYKARRLRTSRFPRFILLVSFTETLLAVLIIDLPYFRPFYRSRRC